MRAGLAIMLCTLIGCGGYDPIVIAQQDVVLLATDKTGTPIPGLAVQVLSATRPIGPDLTDEEYFDTWPPRIFETADDGRALIDLAPSAICRDSSGCGVYEDAATGKPYLFRVSGAGFTEILEAELVGGFTHEGEYVILTIEYVGQPEPRQ
jgi:hypothetical protein